ncbi:MAG: HD domain-containing protein [Elusimicrobiota bacterium]
MKEDRVLRYFLEAGALKRTKRTGWWCSGIKDPESVAEHAFRMSLLAAYIASEEGADPMRASLMGLFHDIPEARVSDAHAVVKRYWKGHSADERRARDEQNASLPRGAFQRLAQGLGRDWDAESSPEALAARDADYLECAIQALEYLWQQRTVAREWLLSNQRRLKTRAGKKLGMRLKRIFESGRWEDFQIWWKDIYRR